MPPMSSLGSDFYVLSNVRSEQAVSTTDGVQSLKANTKKATIWKPTFSQVKIM